MSRSSSRLDPYSAQMREDQKAIINGLLGIIYDNYDTTRRVQARVDSIYGMVIFIMICCIVLLLIGLAIGCYYGCRRSSHALPQSSIDDTVPQTRPRYHYQSSERGVNSPLHQPRKSAPIEL